MRIANKSTKRVLGLALAAALSVGATVALSNSAGAATTPAAAITPKSGSAAGADSLQVKGKGFADADGVSVVAAARFLSVECGVDGTAGTAATAYNVLSSTRATVTTPALAAGTWYLCFFDSTSSTAAVALGQAKFITGTAPVITTVNGIADATTTAISAPTVGGNTLTFVGTSFTKSSVVSVGGVKAATKYVSATKVTATIPAASAAVLKAIKIATEYGSDTSAGNTVTYLGVTKVSPIAGAPSTAVGITLTGTGFNAMTFGSAVSQYVVQFSLGGTPVAIADTVSLTKLCTNIVVESDTELSCKTPATLIGPHVVQILQRDSGTLTDVGAVATVVSRSAIYTGAAF